MTATNPNPGSTTTAGARPTASPSHTATPSTQRVRRFTETKAGVKTTEFLVTVVFVVLAVLAAYQNNSDSYARDDGWRYAAIVAAAYVVSRGLAKLGVREPYSDEIDLR